jgi:dUTP pyrophosphatase
MIVKFKKIAPNAVTPAYSKAGDAAMDLTAISLIKVDKDEYGYLEYDTGLAFEIPEGFVGLLFPRSSISNSGLILANSVGVIDSGYRGSVKFRFKHIPGTVFYKPGDRVGQIIIIPFPQVELQEVEQLSETDRAEDGFGSTGA